MGRPVDSEYLGLTDANNNPLPATEFFLLDNPNFTVPYGDIRLKELKACIIPGLRTPEKRVTDKYLAQRNIFALTVHFNPQDLFLVANSSFVVKGRTTVMELDAMVHTELELDPDTELEFSVDGRVMPLDEMLLKVYEEKDGLVELFCRNVPDLEIDADAAGEDGNDGDLAIDAA